jgi:hypothetical protein
MAEGIKEGRAHKMAFEAFHAGLVAALPEEVASWKTWVDAWEKTQHTEKDKDAPYKYEEASEWFAGVKTSS